MLRRPGALQLGVLAVARLSPICPMSLYTHEEIFGYRCSTSQHTSGNSLWINYGPKRTWSGQPPTLPKAIGSAFVHDQHAMEGEM